ncbi:MAG: CbiX/SirB N-terminal domain-containing protein [Bacillota bacterium]|nr:CbiX/SirB N-terminal domain-containing protein [Bacillota bacterium]
MDGVLILAHGSKRQETEVILNSLVRKVKEKTGISLVIPAFLQFSEQNLEMGIAELTRNGAKNIKIVPMFIFDGVHVTEDIPNEINEIKAKFPEVSIKMSSHIGDDDKLADIIVDRINAIVS